MTMDRSKVQVFAYPEELDFLSPVDLVALVEKSGAGAICVSLAYHRARRVFPRHRRVNFTPGGVVYFYPDRREYGRLVPDAHVAGLFEEPLLRLRDACEERGLEFRAWLVVLHNEALAVRWPDLAAQTVDGTTSNVSLCPSRPESREYVSGLISDVCKRFAPSLIDLEAAIYPAWDPAYTLTLALEPLQRRSVLLGSQCFCAACQELIGDEAEEIARACANLAGPPFGGGESKLSFEYVVNRLSQARGRRVQELLVAAGQAAHTHRCALRVTAPAQPDQLPLQGVTTDSVLDADDVLFGTGVLAGRELCDRLLAISRLTAKFSISMNWSPDRGPSAFAEDARYAATAGARCLALYNLSLVPAAAYASFEAAAGSFLSTKGVS